MDDFQREASNNEEAFKNIIKQVRPDLYALMELLDQSGMNWFVLAHVIRQLNNIALRTGYGNVTIIVENGLVKFVNGESLAKLNEKLISREGTNPYGV